VASDGLKIKAIKVPDLGLFPEILENIGKNQKEFSHRARTLHFAVKFRIKVFFTGSEIFDL
jgi:hypothetical protein